MSEGARKDCRTQGKYSERSQYYEDKRIQKRQDKKGSPTDEDKRIQKRQDNQQKGSPTVKEPQEKKFHKRKSDGGKASNTSLISENEYPVRYEKNSVHPFSQLEGMKKPAEIKNSGKYILSNTENGESVVFYNPNFLEEEEALYNNNLLCNTTNWNEKNIIIHGVEYPQPRLVAWYGPFPYTYSGTTLEPAEMPESILEIKKKVEDYLNKNGINVVLNSVLLNLYRNNKDSVAWHSDDELSMGVCPTIASVSLGATRKFEMRRKIMKTTDENLVVKGEEYFIHLSNGSLLIMDGCMQKDWQHRVPKEYHDRDLRLNLTFRTVYKLEDPGTYPQNHTCNGVLKKSSTRKTNCDVNYDDENFPPLTNDTNPVRKSPASRASMVISSCEFNGSHKWRSKETSCSETSLKSEITQSNDFRDAEQFPNNKTDLKIDDKIHSSDKILTDELSQNKFSLKTYDKITISGNDHCTEAFNNNGSLKDDKMKQSEDFWDSESPPCNNVSKNDEIINRSGEQLNEKSAILNNLNEDKKNVKIDMQNKNLCAYDSNFSSSNVVNATENTRKDKNFQVKESYNVSTNPNNNMQENAQKVKNEPTSGKNKACTLNAEAKVFVPHSQKITFSASTPYNAFELEDLLDYNVGFMDSNSLRKYAFALRDRVLEKITEFSRCHEELKILCELTDGDQTEKNQKIISSRMSMLVRRALGHHTSPNFRKSFGVNPIKHGNQNHFSGRKNHSNFSERHYRH